MRKLLLALALLAAHPVLAAKNPRVKIATSQGDMTLELDAAKAPETVKNFLQYVQAKHYDGTIFHRVIKSFMIQGGGYDKDLKRVSGTKAPIKNEAANGLKNVTGTIAMARTSDPDSATDQFFINVHDNPFLDHRDDTPRGIGYAVFGKVVSGFDVAKKIEAVQTGSKPDADGQALSDVPVQPVVIKSIRVVK
jgi:cyclophilin family peptidyl-prolyl cis-trans isomerase